VGLHEKIPSSRVAVRRRPGDRHLVPGRAVDDEPPGDRLRGLGDVGQRRLDVVRIRQDRRSDRQKTCAARRRLSRGTGGPLRIELIGEVLGPSRSMRAPSPQSRPMNTTAPPGRAWLSSRST
jgi:hypothetical protein